MASSERGSAAPIPSPSSRAATLPRFTARAIRLAFVIGVRTAGSLFLEAADIGQDRVDLAFGKHFAERRHRPGLALLDALDQVFVGVRVAGELRCLAGFAAAGLVAEAAQRGEHLLAVDVARRRLG